ncbi:MAG: chemotaxis protein CheW [Thermodesulfobacteriota bacterium]|nr:chemotaxis protein CheW [Thermodesulfobacteriota bacterium]
MSGEQTAHESRSGGRNIAGQGSETAVPDREGKYLTFELADENYGLEILKVREIIGMMDITPVPQTPKFVKGLINLRGKVIPVVDLRLKFDLPEKKYTERTAIIVVDIRVSSGLVQMGIVVDSVSEVMNISEADIEDTPNFGTGLKTDYIFGLAKAKGRVIILLDIDIVLTDEDLTLAGGE